MKLENCRSNSKRFRDGIRIKDGIKVRVIWCIYTHIHPKKVYVCEDVFTLSLSLHTVKCKCHV